MSFLNNHAKTLAMISLKRQTINEATDGDSTQSSDEGSAQGSAVAKPCRKLTMSRNIKDIMQLIELALFDLKARQQLLLLFRSAKADPFSLNTIVEALAKSSHSGAEEILRDIMHIVPANLRKAFSKILESVNNPSAQIGYITPTPFNKPGR